MLKVVNNLVLVLLLIVCQSCEQCDPIPPDQKEEQLIIELSTDSGGPIIRSLSPGYAFFLKVTSRMPPNGVTIEITRVKDADNTSFSQKLETNQPSTQLFVGGLIQWELYTISVQVTSKSKPDNISSKSFRLVWK